MREAGGRPVVLRTHPLLPCPLSSLHPVKRRGLPCSVFICCEPGDTTSRHGHALRAAALLLWDISSATGRPEEIARTQITRTPAPSAGLHSGGRQRSDDRSHEAASVRTLPPCPPATCVAVTGMAAGRSGRPDWLRASVAALSLLSVQLTDNRLLTRYGVACMIDDGR